MNTITKAMTPSFALHLMDADRGTVANALRAANLQAAYNRWIVNSSPMDSTKEFSKSGGSFPIRSMEELSSLLVALAGVVCDKWVQITAQDMDTICRILLMRNWGSAEWTCEMAAISRQFDAALTQIERVIAAARTSTPLAHKEESKG